VRVTFFEPVDTAMLPCEVPQAVVAACQKLDGAVMSPQAALKKLRAAAGTSGEVLLEDGYIFFKYTEHWSRIQEVLADMFFPDGGPSASEDCEAGMVYDQEKGTQSPVTLCELFERAKNAVDASRPTAEYYATLIRFR
jgi:hypothetical protein